MKFEGERRNRLVDIKWPLGIHEMAGLYPGTMAVIAGTPNSGKTALCLQMVRMNMDKWPVYYFSSEMVSEEMEDRVWLFGENPNDWNWHPFERNVNFADVIEPNALNIVDYLELSDDFYKVNKYLTDIVNKLDKGVAIVALQKNWSQKRKDGSGIIDLARGGVGSIEKPRLYISMDRAEGSILGTLKLSKVKIPVDPRNPTGGLQCTYKTPGGYRIEQFGEWGYG